MPVAFAETDLSRCGYNEFPYGILKKPCPDDEICTDNFGPDRMHQSERKEGENLQDYQRGEKVIKAIGEMEE